MDFLEVLYWCLETATHSPEALGWDGFKNQEVWMLFKGFWGMMWGSWLVRDSQSKDVRDAWQKRGVLLEFWSRWQRRQESAQYLLRRYVSLSDLLVRIKPQGLMVFLRYSFIGIGLSFGRRWWRRCRWPSSPEAFQQRRSGPWSPSFRSGLMLHSQSILGRSISTPPFTRCVCGFW